MQDPKERYGIVKVFTAVAKWQDSELCPYVMARDRNGDTSKILLPRTRPGDPNVREGATLVAAQADDGQWYCLTDYMDDRIGSFKIVNEEIINNTHGWSAVESGAN